MRTVSYRRAFSQLMILHTIRSSFISKWKRGQEGKIAERKRERERGRENKCLLMAVVVFFVKRTTRKYTCLIKRDGQHLAGLLLISNMRNLANDVSHDWSVLMVKIFGVTTTQHFLIIFIKVTPEFCWPQSVSEKEGKTIKLRKGRRRSHNIWPYNIQHTHIHYSDSSYVWLVLFHIDLNISNLLITLANPSCSCSCHFYFKFNHLLFVVSLYSYCA